MNNNLSAWDLQNINDTLYWDNCSLPDIAHEFGTPVYVISKNKIRKNFEEVSNAFNFSGVSTEIFYSVKSNPVPSILKYLFSLGCGAEIISEYELWLVKKLGLSGDKIIVNGVVKSEKFLRCAIEYNVKLINVESENELLILKKIAHESGKKISVGLRINPELKTKKFDFTLSTANSCSHIGLIEGSKEWNSVIEILKSEKLLDLNAIHFHLGSGIKRSVPYKKALRKALEVWDMLIKSGFNPSVLDIGGGFNISTLKEMNLWDAVRIFELNKSFNNEKNSGNNIIDSVSSILFHEIKDFSERNKISVPEIIIEPGRRITSSSQILLLKVIRIIQRDKNITYAVCDAGGMSISPLLFLEDHKILPVKNHYTNQQKTYMLLGSLPSPLDIVSFKRTLPILFEGDILAVMDSGAYFTSLGNNFAGPRCGIILLDNRTRQIIKRKEEFEDMILRDMFNGKG